MSARTWPRGDIGGALQERAADLARRL